MGATDKKLFSKAVRAGSRTYFFDVKESRDGTKYLKISESRRRGSKRLRVRTRLMIFEEHLEAFNRGYQQAMRHLVGGGKRSHVVFRLPGARLLQLLRGRGKAYSVDRKRRIHPNAYRKWTPQDDEQLREEFAKGASTSALAELLGRKESAIRSRLKKLGL